MKKMNALVQGMGTLALVSSLFAANNALAAVGTAGGATIHNYATLTYTAGAGSATIKAAVNVSVQTVAAEPAVVKGTADQTVPSYGTANYSYTITSTSNGRDSFALALSSADVNTAGAPGTSFLLNGTPVTSIQLGASVTSQASAGGFLYIPAGSEVGLTVGSTIKVGATLFTITAVTPGTAASTDTTTGVHTNEVPSRLTVTHVVGGTPVADGEVAAGTQIGQQVTLIERVVASAPATPSGTTTHTVSFTATTTATDLAGAVVVYSSATNSTNTVTTVIIASTSLSKSVRNVSRPSGNTAGSGSVDCDGTTFYSLGVVSKPGDTLEYCLKASVATGQPALAGAALQDDVPPYTVYQANTTKLNNAPLTDATAGVLPLAAGLPVNSPTGAAGEIKPGESAVVVFQVKVD